MRKPFTLLLLVTLLSGCGTARLLFLPFLGPSGSDTTSAQIATPSFLLEGRAARHQDSLMDRLKFLEARPSPSELKLLTLAFRNGPDSSVQVVATYQDDRRLSSHGLTPGQARTREGERIASLRPLWIYVRQAKLTHPVVIRSVFKSRDYLFQNAPMVEDTAEILLPDTVAKPRK